MVVSYAEGFGVKKLVVVDCWCSVGKKKEGKKTRIELRGTPHYTVNILPGFWGTVPRTRLMSLLFNFSDFFSIVVILFRIEMFVGLVSDCADEEWQHCCRWSSN